MQIFENFISYRRSESLAEVQNIYHALLNKGLSTFCDIYSLNAGRFDNGLIQTIDNCTNYILVLSEHSLDRCTDNNDWLTLEINEAISKKKNIICVFIGDFQFPEHLPDQIDEIRYFNGIKYDFTYFDAFIDCLVLRFLTTASESEISDDTRDFVIDGTTLVKYIGSAPIVNVPDHIRTIAPEAFKDKTRITSIRLPKGLINIGTSAFERCINISHITLPSTLESIGRSAFARCYNLSFVALNDELESVDEEAFSFCTKLKTIQFGTEVSHIDSSAFNNCNKLTNIFVAEENKAYSSVDGILYDKHETSLIRCPEGYNSDVICVLPSVDTLAPWSFSKCLNLIDIVLPKHLKRVGEYAFKDCSNILSLTLGDDIVEFALTALSGWNKEQRIVVSKQFNPLIKYNIDQKLREQPYLKQTENDVTAEFVVVKTTFESYEEAAKMAKMLLDNRYIASAQLTQLNVFYTWNDDFCNENEIELSCITKGDLYCKVEAFITQHHSYECCQIVCIPIIKTSKEFAEWIVSRTAE